MKDFLKKVNLKYVVNCKNLKVNKDNYSTNNYIIASDILITSKLCIPRPLPASVYLFTLGTYSICKFIYKLLFYDIPIFYIPKLQHPDPSVERRSGFLPPTISDSKNLGVNINIPYFWAIDKDRDLTINSRLFASEHPLFLGEYRQAFKNSNLVFDFGHTQGYKNTSLTKKAGDKSHFFSKFVKFFNSITSPISVLFVI